MPINEVWTYIADFRNAKDWMGVDNLKQIDGKQLSKGSELTFVSRGAERTSVITDWNPPHIMELSSTQGGVTAKYIYQLKKTFTEKYLEIV